MSSRKKIKKSGKPQAADAVMRAQIERIEELKRENSALIQELKRYREREEGVADALSIAKRKADEYTEEAKIRFMLEYERLEGYRSRWRGYIKDLNKAESLGREVIRTEKLLKECAEEIKQLIDGDFAVTRQEDEDYINEEIRLEGIAEKELSEENISLPFDDKSSPDNRNEQMTEDELKRLIVQLLNKE